MPDKALTLEVLGQIENAAQKVVTRFETIRHPGDFTDSAAGGGKNGCHLYDADRYR